jgi:hypothetical protein
MISQVSGCLISSSSMWSAMVLPRHPAHPRPSRRTRPPRQPPRSSPPARHDSSRARPSRRGVCFQSPRGTAKGEEWWWVVAGGREMPARVDRPRNLARALPVAALCACALAGSLLLQGHAGLWGGGSGSGELYEEGSRGRYGGRAFPCAQWTFSAALSRVYLPHPFTPIWSTNPGCTPHTTHTNTSP